MTSIEVVAPPRPLAPRRLQEEAEAIGHRLVREAVFHRDACNWLVRRINYPGEVKPGDVPTVEPLGPSVYSGTAGVGLFLLRLHAASGEPEFLRVAQGAIRTGIRTAFSEDPRWRNGYYLGALGVAWAAAEVAEASGSDAFGDAARRIVRQLWERRRQPRLHDVMFGAGGAIPTLLAMHERTGMRLAREFAEWLGDDAVRHADVEDGAWSWKGDFTGPYQPNLTGFSHGAGGIGWGLAFLARATGKRRVEEAARGAFAYERRAFDAEEGNWRDYRNFRNLAGPPPRKFAVLWCHGAPGIGVSRIQAARCLGDPALLEDARIAAAATRRSVDEFLDFPGRDTCVCHGLTGNAEAVWLMEEALGVPDARERALGVGHWMVERYGKVAGADWPTAVTKGQYPPLVTGASGAGHFLLRLATPGRFPTALTPPHPEV